MDTVGTGSASQFRLSERQVGWKPPSAPSADADLRQAERSLFPSPYPSLAFFNFNFTFY